MIRSFKSEDLNAIFFSSPDERGRVSHMSLLSRHRQKLCPDGARTVSPCHLLPTFCPDGARKILYAIAFYPLPLASYVAPMELEMIFQFSMIQTCRPDGAILIIPCYVASLASSASFAHSASFAPSALPPFCL